MLIRAIEKKINREEKAKIAISKWNKGIRTLRKNGRVKHKGRCAPSHTHPPAVEGDQQMGRKRLEKWGQLRGRHRHRLKTEHPPLLGSPAAPGRQEERWVAVGGKLAFGLQNHGHFLKLLIFYWGTVDLQCCGSFCCTAKRVSYTNTNLHSCLDSVPIYAITEYWVEFPVLYGRFLLVIYFIYSGVSMSVPISQFIPHPLVTMSLFSTSVTLFLVCR